MNAKKTDVSRIGIFHFAVGIATALALGPTAGCGGSKVAQKQDRDFFTSGSVDADQRASQRMARAEQLSGSGEASGENGVKQRSFGGSGTNRPGGETVKAAITEGKLALYDRLGGDAGISNIVADFTPRALDDPRVNWKRTDVKRGGLSFERGKSVAWDDNPDNAALLKKHLIQFFALATGGPAGYEGKEMKSAHAYMHISNPEFDAAIGDLKASLDRLKIANREQKELLSIVESTRPQIVTER